MEIKNEKNENSRIYANPVATRVTVRIESRLYGALKMAARICDRSLRSELRVRARDCLIRSQELNPEVPTLTPKQGTHITFELEHDLNKKLSQIAKDSGRSKEEEIILRVMCHLNKYELFVSPDCFKPRLTNF